MFRQLYSMYHVPYIYSCIYSFGLHDLVRRRSLGRAPRMLPPCVVSNERFLKAAKWHKKLRGDLIRDAGE